MKEKTEHILTGVLIMLVLPCVVMYLLDGQMSDIYCSIKNETEYISVKTNSGVLEMGVEEYVIGVTAAQIPASYAPEAIKAQMVAARTNIYRQIQENGKVEMENFLTMEELERAGAAEKFLRAQRETKGEVLTWEDKPILASYHALSAGSTRDANEIFQSGDYPYLKAKKCPSDEEAPEGEQMIQIDDAWAAMEVVSRDEAGYVLQIELQGERMSGEEFRNLLGLPSSNFEVLTNEEGVYLKVHGIGHGVGMSQYTAQQLAQNGTDYKEILGYFYSGTKIARY